MRRVIVDRCKTTWTSCSPTSVLDDNSWQQSVNFYGPALHVNLQDNGPKGLSGFRFEISTGDSLEAHIDLNTTSNRVQAAALHELLHLSLPARGYPVVRAWAPIVAPPSRVQETDIPLINVRINQTFNVVQHDIFVGDFLASGLPLDQFLGPRAFPHYGDKAKEVKGKTIDPARVWIHRSMWTLFYLGERFGTRHGDPRAEDFSKMCSLGRRQSV